LLGNGHEKAAATTTAVSGVIQRRPVVKLLVGMQANGMTAALLTRLSDSASLPWQKQTMPLALVSYTSIVLTTKRAPILMAKPYAPKAREEQLPRPFHFREATKRYGRRSLTLALQQTTWQLRVPSPAALSKATAAVGLLISRPK